MKKNKAITLIIALILVLSAILTGCGIKKDKVVIYTSSEDFRVEYYEQRLQEQFPNLYVVFEYMSTGDHAARLLSEGTETEADITLDLEYGYLERLAEEGYLADLSKYDYSIFTEDMAVSKYYLPELRNGGAIIVNKEVLKEKDIDKPSSYEDLLKREYKGLISMPNPKSSGTGYMFLKSLVNAWGETKALSYFNSLTKNILQYTTSGSGPVNALKQGEVAIGLGMTSHAVKEINDGTKLEVLFFEEGSPYSAYGYGIVKGKEDNPSVKEVFDFMYNTLVEENVEKFYPEQIYKNKTFEIENYPKDIKYSDMSDNTPAEKERLLKKWNH